MDKYSVRVWRDPALRASKCAEKDAITGKILDSMKIGPQFRAILMPCLHGTEVDYLEKRGVSADRMFAIERVERNWKDMKADARVTLTPRPLDAHLAIDHIEAVAPGGFDLIYGDFLGQPDFTHAEFLFKIFKLRMIRPRGKLLLTFGLTRCRRLVKEFNTMLLGLGGSRHVPTRHYVDAAIELTGHRKYRKRIREYVYKSRSQSNFHRYVVTEVDF